MEAACVKTKRLPLWATILYGAGKGLSIFLYIAEPDPEFCGVAHQTRLATSQTCSNNDVQLESLYVVPGDYGKNR